VIGALSLAEVLSKLTDSGEDPDRVLDAITRLPLDVVGYLRRMPPGSALSRTWTSR